MASAFQGTAVLITGGLGFIGSNLARRLVDLGAHVTLADALLPGSGANLFNIADFESKVRVHIGDLRDYDLCQRLVQGKAFLFHLAGHNSHRESMQDPLKDLDLNCRLTLTLLNACRAHNPTVRLVYAGTRQTYGKPDSLPVSEDHSLRPVDVNGINKMAAEYYQELYSRAYGMHFCSLRLTNTIGPGMRVRDSRQNFFGLWIRKVLEGQPIDVWGGDQVRDLSHVDDVIDAFLLAASRSEAKGKIFNVGGPQAINLKSLAELLIEVNGGGRLRFQPFPADRKVIDIGSFCANFAQIKETLGWQPRMYLREAAAQTLTFYRTYLQHYL